MIYRVLILVLVLHAFTFVDSKRLRRYPNPMYDDFGWEIDQTLCNSDKNVNPIISVRNNTYGQYFALSCYAAYPITLEFNGKRFNKANTKILLTSADPGNSTKACYILHLTSYTYFSSYSPVGTYLCKSIGSPLKVTSIYAFAQDNWGFPAFNAAQKQVLYINNKEEKLTKLTLPCPSTKESMTKATLVKYEPITNEKLDIENDKELSITYDQKIGFTVGFSHTKHENASDPINPVGKYLCKDPSDLEGPYEIEFDVQESEFVVFPNKTNITINQGQITLECFSGEPISLKVLDSTSVLKVIPNTDFKTPESYIQQGYLYGVRSSFQTNDLKVRGQIACVTDKEKKNLFVWKLDNEYICKCEWNITQNIPYHHFGYDQNPNEKPEYGESQDSRFSSIPNNDWSFYDPGFAYGELICHNEKANIVDASFLSCRNDIECQMMRNCVEVDNSGDCPYINDYYYSGRQQTNTSTLYVQLSPGLLRCSADGYINVVQITTDLDKNMHFDGQKPKTLLEIRVSEDLLYTGDKMIFSCRSSDYYVLSNKIVWGFEFKNKTLVYPTFDLGPNQRGYSWHRGNDDDRISSDSSGSIRTSFLTIPSKDAIKLWCYAPRRNSTEWEHTSVDLNIQDAIPAENPPKCPTGLSATTPFIVMLRNSSISGQRVRLPHRVDGTDQTIYDPVESISLYCLAKYPVQWLKDGVNISDATSKRSNCKQKNNVVLKNRLYKSTIVASVFGTNSSGNYTCRSTLPHQSKQTSVYIYAIGHENRTTFINEGHHYQVFHEYKNQSSDFKKWAVIPCRLNNPKATPYLFLDHPEEERMEFINFDNSHLKFDTKIGFSIDVTSRFVKDLTTSFICSDHKDGSFIGNIVTLRLVHNVTEMLTTTTPSSANSTGIPATLGTTSKPTVTRGPTVLPVKVQTSSSSGFVVSIVLLTSLCLACFGVIYYLYQKVMVQQAKAPITQELDWANANNHTTGNNIQNYSDTSTNPPDESIIDNNRGNDTDNHTDNHVDNYADDDHIIKFESMPTINFDTMPTMPSTDDTENDFNYKQF